MTNSQAARMSDKYGFDIMDGRQVPRLVVTGDFTLSETHQGGVHVEGGRFCLAGTLQGSLDLQPGVSAIISGSQQGSVLIGNGSVAVVTGSIEGSAHVSRGAVLLIEKTGRLGGPLRNDGEVVVRGVFGGAHSGHGKLRCENDGHIMQPIVRNGVSYYGW